MKRGLSLELSIWYIGLYTEFTICNLSSQSVYSDVQVSSYAYVCEFLANNASFFDSRAVSYKERGKSRGVGRERLSGYPAVSYSYVRTYAHALARSLT